MVKFSFPGNPQYKGPRTFLITPEYKLIIFRPSIIGTKPLNSQLLHTASLQNDVQLSKQQTEICKAFYSFTYYYSSLCDAIKS